MIKQIANWTLGGFFRTLGKFLLYALIVFLISMFFVKNDIKLPKWLVMSVDASTLENWSVSESRYRYDNAGTPAWSSWESTPHTWSPTYPIQKLQFRVKASNGLSIDNTYVLKFGYLPTPDALSPSSVLISSNVDTTLTDYQETITCSNWAMNSNNYYLISCSFTPMSDYSSSQYLYVTINFYQDYLTSFRSFMYGFEERVGINSIVTQQTDMINNSIINLGDNINNMSDSITNSINEQIESQQVCEVIDMNKIEIDNKYLNSFGVLNGYNVYGVTNYIFINKDSKITPLVVDNNGGATFCFYNINKTIISCTSNASITLNNNISIPNDSNYVRFSINKTYNRPQFNICRNGNQALQDTLTDDDTSSYTSGMADFLNNFSLTSDGTISSLITLPITFIQDVLSDSSDADFCTIYREKNICLPSGQLIWGRNDVSAFVAFFNLFVGGLLSWKMLRSFVLTSERAINPKDNKIEVARL